LKILRQDTKISKSDTKVSKFDTKISKSDTKISKSDIKISKSDIKISKSDIWTFEAAEDYINSTPRFTSKSTMEDTKAFLHRLGDPDRKMRIIHVAGTNGKGSVCAYLRSILEAAGYRTALFTSPHLVDIRERFVVDGQMISREDFLRAFRQIYDLLDWEALEGGAENAYHPTYFEYLFFMAMVLFAEKRPDFCILETGLGGRLDATNSVAAKELAVITRISLDHVEYLGDTVEKIAFEKAGIMQAGAPAVCWDTCPGTTEVFRRRAGELGISCRFVSQKDYAFSKINRKTIDFCVLTEYDSYVSLSLGTIAKYQMENCALAVRAVSVLDGGKSITTEQIRKGVKDCFWAGRMEEVLPEVYVDGGHNEDGIRAFLETVAADGHQGRRSLLFGVVKDKDYGRMVQELMGSGFFERAALARMRTGRTVSAEELRALSDRYPECRAEVYDSVESAFCGLMERRREGERIYVVGSLYLVGEMKELLARDERFRDAWQRRNEGNND